MDKMSLPLSHSYNQYPYSLPILVTRTPNRVLMSLRATHTVRLGMVEGGKSLIYSTISPSSMKNKNKIVKLFHEL